jgi:hypothetical protein
MAEDVLPSLQSAKRDPGDGRGVQRSESIETAEEAAIFGLTHHGKKGLQK